MRSVDKHHRRQQAVVKTVDDVLKHVAKHIEQPLSVEERHIYERALGILHRMRLENTKRGWPIFSRWYYSDEPLRNDASNLLRQIGYQAEQPEGTKDIND
jgi:hypothetical protein